MFGSPAVVMSDPDSEPDRFQAFPNLFECIVGWRFVERVRIASCLPFCEIFAVTAPPARGVKAVSPSVFLRDSG